MFKSVLEGIRVQQDYDDHGFDSEDSKEKSDSEPDGGIRVHQDYNDHGFDSEDSKETSDSEPDGQTNMEYVNKFRDFTKTSDSDLINAFEKLRLRCSQTWNSKLESRTQDFHFKILLLKQGNTAKYIDAEIYKSYEVKELNDSKDLIMSPNLWDMYVKSAGLELRQVLHHFSTYIPFEGRPFIRLWLEALAPCFSRWILLSDSAEAKVIDTLKNFLGAFGQPGIVVCLADKGEKLLKTLQDSARSVEALGRGTVERYYWKRLAEASCGGNKDWRTLASIPNKELEKSQLDILPKNWLIDSTDFVHVFANIVSTEIRDSFKQRLDEIVDGNKIDGYVHAGPAKTLERSIAKCHEYRSEYRHGMHSIRWSNFRKSFKETYGRSAKRPSDFVWNIVDFARCSIILPDASELLKTKELLKEHFKIVCVKNGYSSDNPVKGSGYRDIKLLVEVEFDNLILRKVPQVEGKINLICEIQLMCEKWLQNKKTTSLSYKVLRARNLKEFLSDFAKYLRKSSDEDKFVEMDTKTVVKNGWRNLAKMYNFDSINGDELLLDACNYGWNAAGVECLVNRANVNLEIKNSVGRTAAILATINGHDNILKTLINLRSNIEAWDRWDRRPIHYAVLHNRENCVRLLLNANCSRTKRTFQLGTPLDLCKNKPEKQRILKLLKGEHVPPLKKKSKKLGKDRYYQKSCDGRIIDELFRYAKR